MYIKGKIYVCWSRCQSEIECWEIKFWEIKFDQMQVGYKLIFNGRYSVISTCMNNDEF